MGKSLEFRVSHVHLTAVINAVKDNDIAYDNIEEVTITTIARACDILFDPTNTAPSRGKLLIIHCPIVSLRQLSIAS